MDPVWAAVAELWWVAPTAGGAGAAGFAVLRKKDAMSGRRLGYDAARLDLRHAQREARTAADAARVARAEAIRVAADHAASKADAAAVAAARKAQRETQLEARAADARVKAARARLTAERGALGDGELPLDRIRTRHDAVLARWMDYETDPAKLLAFPAMSDGRYPATAAFLSAMERARDLRPRDTGARLTAAEFGEYRGAVEGLERAFDIAECSVRGESVPQELPDALRDAARAIMERSVDVLGRTTHVLGSWTSRRRDPR